MISRTGTYPCVWRAGPFWRIRTNSCIWAWDTRTGSAMIPNQTHKCDTERVRKPICHPTALWIPENLSADNVDLLVPEVAFVYGPFSFQGEYFYNKVHSNVAGNPTLNGWYAYVSFFLTGESRAYKSSVATFDRVKPNHNFSISGEGLGAFEVALRYSTVDLTDALITGGKENNWTFGFNWYLTPNTRFMFNYVRADVTDRDEGDVILNDDNANIFETRFQIDF